MVTDQSVSYKFDWGEAVEVVSSAPQKYLDIQKGSICGIREIDNENAAKDFEEPIGTILYLIEGSNGEAIEIPEKYLIVL